MQKNYIQKKHTRKELIKYLDDLTRKILFLKNENKCFICECKEKLTIGHLITRKSYNIRWDFDNVEIQCRGCNLLHEYHPEIFFYYYIKCYGFKKFENLYKKSKEKIKNMKNFLEETKKSLEELLKKYTKI